MKMLPSSPDRAYSVTKSTARRDTSNSCAKSCVNTPNRKLLSSTRSPFNNGNLPRNVSSNVVLPVMRERERNIWISTTRISVV